MKTLIQSLFVLIIASSLACASAGKNTTIGAVGGTALGAGLGAIIGSATGDTGRGLAIGAGAGALAGGLTGNALDQQAQENDARRGDLVNQQAQIEENRRLIEELRRRGADVHGSSRGVVVNLPDILFRFDSSELTSDARRTIGGIADVVKDVPNRRVVSVEGHTDSVGAVVYNQKLSVQRAESVARELEYGGMTPTRLRVRGFGEGAPIASNNSDSGRSRNRRVEVVIEN